MDHRQQTAHCSRLHISQATGCLESDPIVPSWTKSLTAPTSAILCIGPHPTNAVHWLRLIAAGLSRSALETVSRRKDTLAGGTLAAKACAEADHEHLTLGPAEARTASSWPRAAAVPQSLNLTPSPAGETERCTLCTCCCRVAAMAEGCLVHDVFWCMSSKPIVTCVVTSLLLLGSSDSACSCISAAAPRPQASRRLRSHRGRRSWRRDGHGGDLHACVR